MPLIASLAIGAQNACELKSPRKRCTTFTLVYFCTERVEASWKILAGLMPGRIANPLHGPWQPGTPFDVDEDDVEEKDEDQDNGTFDNLEKAFAASSFDDISSDDSEDSGESHVSATSSHNTLHFAATDIVRGCGCSCSATENYEINSPILETNSSHSYLSS